MNRVLYLGNNLSTHGFTPTSVETLGVRLEDHYIMVRGSSFRNPVLRMFHMLILVWKHRHFDSLLIDTYSTRAFWFAYLTSYLARMVNLDYILILRGGHLPQRAQRSPGLMRLLLGKAQHVVCPSEFLRSHMQRFYERDYVIIPNYIDIDNYPFRQRTIGSRIRLLWVRSFHTIYNPLLAVDIVVQMKQRGYDVELCMVGPDKDGSLSRARQYAEDQKVSGFIRFTGRLRKTEWITLSEGFDIFINTTNVDNTPVSVMEAMALGLPVISTNVGGIPYIIDHEQTGILVPPENVDAFISAILRIRQDPEFSSRISIAAREKTESWDWEVVKQQWINLLSHAHSV